MRASEVWRALVVCCLGLFFVLSAASQVTSSETPVKHVVFYVIPLPGHANPLLAQAYLLAEKGHHVSLVSPSIFSKYVEANKHPKLQFIGSGRCDQLTDRMPQLFEAAAAMESFSESSTMIFDWINSLHGCMFNIPRQLFEPANRARKQGQLQSGEKLNPSELPEEFLKLAGSSYPDNLLRPVDLFVVDATTVSGFDMANELGVPFVVNNPDLAYLISPRIVPPVDLNPMMFSKVSKHEILANPARWFIQRAVLPPLRLLVFLLVKFQRNKAINDIRREQSGLTNPIDVFTYHRGRLVLQNSVLGLEYPRYISPAVVPVGPCVQPNQETSLSEAEQAWFNATDSVPVVYISMGTIAPLSQNQTETILRGLKLSGVLDGRVRVLWKLPKAQKDVLNQLSMSILGKGIDQFPSSIRAIEWVSSQVGVLSHKSTKIFISHCGINSAHETMLYAGGRVQMLCIPMFGDQLDMAQAVTDAGAGMHLDKFTMTPEQIRDGVELLLKLDKNAEWRRRGEVMRELVKAAGGTSKAVQWIEFILQTTSWNTTEQDEYSYITLENDQVVTKTLSSPFFQVDGPITGAHALTVTDAYLPNWQWFGFDVALIFCIIFYFMKNICSCLCGCSCLRRRSKAETASAIETTKRKSE